MVWARIVLAVASPSFLHTVADLGLRRDEIHEARQVRDAERKVPGLIERTLEERIF